MDYVVRVVYHLNPKNQIRAVQFFRARPMLMGHVLKADTSFRLTAEQLAAHRPEIEPMVRDGIIEIQTLEGKVYAFPPPDGLRDVLVPEPPPVVAPKLIEPPKPVEPPEEVELRKPLPFPEPLSTEEAELPLVNDMGEEEEPPVQEKTESGKKSTRGRPRRSR